MGKRTIQIATPSIGLEEWEATKACYESGWLTQGPKVAAFEQAWAQRHNCKHAVAVTSCTTGLHLVLAALGIGPGDEVLVPAFTWIATANVVVQCGAKPVFVDVMPRSYNIDPDLIASKVTERTKAIIPVHLFGFCADMDAIHDALPPHVHVIEDAACATGSIYKDESAGSIGIAGVFSLHPRKTITTGEGGMITTNNDRLAEKLRVLKNHGASLSEEQRHLGPKPYLLPAFEEQGYNYRMTDIQGAIGLVQLGKLEGLLDERRACAAYYRECLQDLRWLELPKEPKSGLHSWQAFVCRVNPQLAPMPRNAMMELLQDRGISTRPGTHAVHALDYYQRVWGTRVEDCPVAWDCDQNTLAIPLHNCMSEEDYNYVVDAFYDLAKMGGKQGCAASPAYST